MNEPVPTPKPGEMLALARHYASRGWHSFAVTYNSKIPIKGTNGFKDATTDPVLLAGLWKGQTLANVAIATGPSGLLVVDVDVSGDKVGAHTWADLTARHGHVDTYTVKTWTGGLQFYYRMPAEVLSSGTGGLGPDVDTRGQGGYVVAAGSRVEGYAYTVEHDLPVADCPLWIPEALRKPARKPFVPFDDADADQDEVLARVASLASDLKSAPDGQGNDTASRVAFMVGQYVGAGQIDEHRAISLLLDAVAGWNFRKDKDFKALILTIERQVAIGARSPRVWARRSNPLPKDEPVMGQEAIQPGLGANDPVQPVPDETPEDYRNAVRIFRTLDLDAGERPEDNAFFTDLRQAEKFSERVLVARDGQPRYIWTPEFHWMMWTGTVWRDVADTHIMSIVQTWTARQMDHAVRYAEQLLIEAAPKAVADKEKSAAILKEARERGEVTIKGWKSRLSISRMEAVAKIAKGMALKENQKFDQNPDIINTPQGIVNLKTGVVRPGRPSDRCRKITAADYEPGFTHPDWEKVLESVPKDSLDWFQRFMGQAISGYAQREDQMVIMQGGGSNGKTLIMKGVKAAIGSYFAEISDRALESGSNVHPTELMDLYGARLALLEETEEARHLDTNRLKKIVGTEVIKARYMNKDSMGFPATHTFIINTNFKPLVKENDHGTWRRLTLFPFPYKFVPPHMPLEAENERHGDLELKIRISRSEQQKAALAWLVAGAVAWYAQGEVMGEPPQRVVDYTLGWRKENDVLLGFFDSGIVHIVEANPCITHVLSTDLLTALNAYLAERGHHPWTITLMNSRLAEHEVLKGRISPKRRRAGSKEAGQLSLMPGVTDRRYGVGVNSYATAPPAVGQYPSWSNLSFSPVNAVVTQQPLDNLMTIAGE